MIIDTFMFNDEFEMLDLHLALTESYVDRWIILEGNRTWSGIAKPFHLTQNLSRYARYQDRITVIALDVPQGYVNWQCENHSRASLQQGIDQFGAEDIIIHGDLDEILNPELVPAIIETMDQNNKPVACVMEMFVYKFDQKLDRNWNGSIVARKRMFTNPQQLYKGANTKRKDRSHCVIFPGAAGWHWTWIGNDDRVRSKVLSCIESQHRDPEQVLGALKNLDAASAINHKCNNSYHAPQYPAAVMAVLQRYPYWTNAAN